MIQDLSVVLAERTLEQQARSEGGSLSFEERKEEEMLNSDLTFAYRKANGISSPKISSESETKIMGVMGPAFGACM